MKVARPLHYLTKKKNSFLLNGEPSIVLGRSALALTKGLDLW